MTAAFEAGLAHEYLQVRSVIAPPVTVVLCAALTVKRQPADVLVVGRRDIALWLHKRPAVLAEREIEAIWGTRGDPAPGSPNRVGLVVAGMPTPC